MGDPPSPVPLHVWLNTGPHWTGSSVRRGLLIAWRPITDAGQPGGWEGWVIAAYTYSTGSASAIRVEQGWYLKDHIRPARTGTQRRADGVSGSGR